MKTIMREFKVKFVAKSGSPERNIIIFAFSKNEARNEFIQKWPDLTVKSVEDLSIPATYQPSL